jgi:hypothetical protein
MVTSLAPSDEETVIGLLCEGQEPLPDPFSVDVTLVHTPPVALPLEVDGEVTLRHYQYLVWYQTRWLTLHDPGTGDLLVAAAVADSVGAHDEFGVTGWLDPIEASFYIDGICPIENADERIAFDFTVEGETMRLGDGQAGTLGASPRFEVILGEASLYHEAFIDAQYCFVNHTIVAVPEP